MEKVHSIPTVGGRIKYIRERKNFSQEAVGKDAGISQRALSKIELDQTNASIYRIYQIAKSLKVHVHLLIPDQNWNSTYTAYGIVGTLFIRLVRWFKKCAGRTG